MKQSKIKELINGAFFSLIASFLMFPIVEQSFDFYTSQIITGYEESISQPQITSSSKTICVRFVCGH